MPAPEIALVGRLYRYPCRKGRQWKQVWQLEIAPDVRVSNAVNFRSKFSRVMRYGHRYLPEAFFGQCLRHVSHFVGGLGGQKLQPEGWWGETRLIVTNQGTGAACSYVNRSSI